MSKLERFRNSKFNKAYYEFEEKFKPWLGKVAAVLFVVAIILWYSGWRP